MGTEKRERQKANRAAKVAAQEAAEAKARRVKAIRNVVLFGIGIIVVALILGLTACGSTKDGTATSDNGENTATSASTSGTDDPGTPTSSGSGSDSVSYGDGACPPDEAGGQPVIDFTDAPKLCIDPSRTYTATFTTNNFVVLARYGYFDGTDLFRTELSSGIIQGGSPHTQSDTDEGPGYTIPDEALPFSAEDYGPGALAMARTSAPDSGSAQFFLLAGDGGRYLGDPDSLGPDAGSYVVFGRTVRGLEVLEAIAALDDGTGRPSTAVTIESVVITES